MDRDGVRRDIQLKGSGRTPFSRNGDGRAALGPVLREYVVSEAMAALGIPTTRALAAVATGETVIREGSGGAALYVIESGEVTVTVGGDLRATLGPGDHFGEFALISRQVRAATVTAETPLTCQAIDFWDFRSFANDNPEILWKLLEHVVGLVANERDRSGPAPAQTI